MPLERRQAILGRARVGLEPLGRQVVREGSLSGGRSINDLFQEHNVHGHAGVPFYDACDLGQIGVCDEYVIIFCHPDSRLLSNQQ